MGDKSGIQWTDATWNPTTGCTKVSPGCQHCYAETVADRFWPTQYPKVPSGEGRHQAGHEHEEVVWRPRRFTDVQCHPDRLDQPLRWKRPRRIFVNSMSDLFHEDVPDRFIDQVFAVMLESRHTFQVLTKRPERMRDYLSQPHRAIQVADTARREKPGAVDPVHHGLDISNWPLQNVWLGVSVEDQSTADRRIPLLKEVPAVVRFLSCEPLLGPIDFDHDTEVGVLSDLMPYEGDDGLDWVIVGGESGAQARPCDVAWVRSIRDQCREASVPCFVKQLGSRPLFPDEECAIGNEPIHGKGADPSEWPEDLRVREFPEVGGS